MRNRIGVLGLGLIGKQRINAINSHNDDFDIYAFDPNISNFQGVEFVSTEDEFFKLGLRRIIVATPHHLSTKLSIKALDSGAEVLMEKPMGLNLVEAEKIFRHHASSKLKIGFNYRFMPAIEELKTLIDAGKFGKLNQISIQIGHGGKPSDRESWKLNPVQAGGGVLIDPGIHIFDLLLYLFSCGTEDFKNCSVIGWKGFWNTGIEEVANVQGFLCGIPFSVSTSVVSWKTKFKIEVIGEDSYAELEGRGRTDGNQTLRLGERWAWQNGVSQKESELTLTNISKDMSIEKETHAWLDNSNRVANAQNGLEAMRLLSKFQNCLKVL